MANDYHTPTLQQTLSRRATRVLRSDLARRMGYARTDEALLARIEAVLADELLGMDDSGYDMRFTSGEFLTALCDALDVDAEQRELERARIQAIVAHRSNAFRPMLFVDTGFKRTNEPAFVLASIENRRWLYFERAFVDLDLAAQFAAASERAASHYREHAGELPIWGTIQRYLFQYGPDNVLVLDPQGRAVAETDAIRVDHAGGLSVNGRDVSGVSLRASDSVSANDSS